MFTLNPIELLKFVEYLLKNSDKTRTRPQGFFRNISTKKLF